jgi:hypothetical protein
VWTWGRLPPHGDPSGAAEQVADRQVERAGEPYQPVAARQFDLATLDPRDVGLAGSCADPPCQLFLSQPERSTALANDPPE